MNCIRYFTALFFLLAVSGCDLESNGGGTAGPVTNAAFVLNTDYTTGSFAAIDITTLDSTGDAASRGTVNSDAVARTYAGKVYVVNRWGRDNIQVLDPVRGLKTTVEFSVGDGSNPQDIAFAGPGKAYVTRMNLSSVLIINPATGAVLGTIDLAAFADADGVPDMAYMHVDQAANRLYVALQRLDSASYYAPTDYSSVVVIDMTDDTVEEEIRLQWGADPVVNALNPFSRLRFVPSATWGSDGHDHLFVACTGGWGASTDTGVIAIDMTDLECEEGWVMQNSADFGEIMDFELRSSSEAYAVTSNGSWDDPVDSIIKFNPADGTLTSTILTNNSYSLVSLSLHSSGRLFVCDRTATAPGVRVYDTADGDAALNGGKPVDTGLPPFMILFIE